MFDDFDGYEQPESWFEDSPYEGIYHQEPGDYDDTYDTDEDTDEFVLWHFNEVDD